MSALAAVLLAAATAPAVPARATTDAAIPAAPASTAGSPMPAPEPFQKPALSKLSPEQRHKIAELLGISDGEVAGPEDTK